LVIVKMERWLELERLAYMRDLQRRVCLGRGEHAAAAGSYGCTGGEHPFAGGAAVARSLRRRKKP
jgi:hypothetical protein